MLPAARYSAGRMGWVASTVMALGKEGRREERER